MAFIAFEGLDGSGKSTLIRGLTDLLDQQTMAYILTREPGGTELGEEIRQLLLRVDGEAPNPRAELLLYEASRAQLVDSVIRPAISDNKWVICDRYTASTMAFQAGGRHLPEGNIRWLNDYATDGVYPDLWVLLDLPVEESAKRMQVRGDDQDRFEREEQEFHERVRQQYLALAKAESDRWLVLDACQKPTELIEALVTELRKRKWLPS